MTLVVLTLGILALGILALGILALGILALGILGLWVFWGETRALAVRSDYFYMDNFDFVHFGNTDNSVHSSTFDPEPVKCSLAAEILI